ncbi:C39 family peptidase [Patescibacteria group bacterium]
MKVFSRLLLIISILAIFIAVFLIFSTDKIIGIVSSINIAFTSPENTAQNIPINSQVIISFDKPVERQSILHEISPETPGEWNFENPLIKNHLYRNLAFTPVINFQPETNYEVNLQNIKGFGFGESTSFSFSFKTDTETKTETLVTLIENENPTTSLSEITLIDTPFYWQKSKLSCEAASLRMALATKGIYVSEDEIMKEIGYDPTGRKGNVWGNPYEHFIGDINGKICETGYGVYWEPVERAAKKWREARAISGWNLPDLIKELESGNPIIFWGVLPTGILTDCSWYTEEGKYIKAWKEDHVRTIVGFIGSSDNPSKIIIHDPLSGTLYWPTDFFMDNWKAFEYSAVVIR